MEFRNPTSNFTEDIPLIAQQIDVSSTGTPAPFQIIGVPEPSTWAMLTLGVAMIGLAARRRTRATAVAA